MNHVINQIWVSCLKKSNDTHLIKWITCKKKSHGNKWIVKIRGENNTWTTCGKCVKHNVWSVFCKGHPEIYLEYKCWLRIRSPCLYNCSLWGKRFGWSPRFESKRHESRSEWGTGFPRLSCFMKRPPGPLGRPVSVQSIDSNALFYSCIIRGLICFRRAELPSFLVWL